MSDKNFDPAMKDTCELKEAWADGKKLYYVEDIPGLLEQITCLNKQLAKANDYTAELEVRKDALEESLNGCTEKVLSLSGKLAKANERADYYMKLITSDIGYEHAKDLEKGILEEIENRDNREEWLDKLSGEIARYFGVDIGEHSSAKNPWVEAFEAIPEDTLNKFAIEKKLNALDDLLEEIQCSVVVPKRYEQLQEPYLEGIKHCIQFIECQSEQLRKEQEQ